MSERVEEFRPPQRLLLGPGPSSVNPRVLQAMTQPVLGHLDPVFFECMDAVYDMLCRLFRTSNKMTLPLSSTGTGGMEAALCNILERGDTTVIAINGFFGRRMADIARRCGADVHTLEFPLGTAVDPDVVEEELKRHSHVKLLGVVHGETSTGVLSDLQSLVAVAHRYDALIIADTVSSLGGEEVAVDDWDVDICYSATQKCVGAPPGLAPITLGPRATDAMRSRETPVQSYYLGMADLETYWSNTRAYHHTTPISMMYALREALAMMVEEGLENRIERHARCSTALRTGLQAMGIGLFADPNHHLNPLTTAVIPDGVQDANVRTRLLEDYNIEISGGLGDTRGRIWRIGLMGDSCREVNVLALLSALERILSGEGFPVEPGIGVAAAQRSLASAS